MDNKELLKELESLKKRISQLESQKKDNLSMFGRSYSQIGDSNSDFLIKTKGQVKIQWGSKFIDIIKDGKLNVNTDFIFTAESADKLGVKDGLYIVSEDSNNSVYLKLGDNIINLAGEVGNTYVSFLEEQETTSDQKHQALINAGFLHETLDSIDQNSLQNGIIYIESEQKLYTVVNGTMTELGFTFPNPFTDQFVIAKTDNNKKGAILIKGTGIENSLAFESLLIYTDADSTTFESDNSIVYNIGGTKVLSLSALSALFNIPITSSKFQSLGANEQTGFRLYMQGGSSYLEVDNLILRNQDDPSQIHLFPEYWLMKNNIILKAELVPQDTGLNQLSIELTQSNEFNIGEIVAFYTKTVKEVSIGMQDVNIYDDDGNIIGTKQEEQFKQIESYSRVEGEIVNIENNIIIVNCFINLNEDQAYSLSQQFIYLIKSSTNDMPIKIKDNNIDIVEYSDQKDENGNLIPSIESRFGNLEELGLLEGSKEKSVPIKGHGIFSKQGYFKKASYIDEYELDEDDNSSKLASTEWVNRKLTSLNVDIDMSILKDEDIDVEAYFSNPEIQQLLQDQEIGTTVTYLGQFGILTISKSERDQVFSAIVRAITDGNVWSHRSINGTYDSGTNSWYGTSTFIIKDQFNPGYYWSKEYKNNKPISPEYIGTVNTESVSEDKPYILYTNDGKVWKLIDRYISPNKDLIYFAASGQAACTIPGSQAVPMGFIGVVKTDGTNQVKIGKSNYAVSSFDKDNAETGDVRGKIPKSTRALLINTLKVAVPGVIPKISGLPTLFSIKVSDIDTIPENSINLLGNSETSISISQILNDSKIQVRNYPQFLSRWTNSEGIKYNENYPGIYKSIGEIDFWREDINIKILAGIILQQIFLHVPGTSAKQARDSIYSEMVGFSQSWTSTHWENFCFFQMKGVCESSFSAPSDDNLNAKAGLTMDNNLSIVCGSSNIYGDFHVTYRDYKWPESPDSNFPYLSAMFAITDVEKVDEVYRLPYPSEININLVLRDSEKDYKIVGRVGDEVTITQI